MLVDSLQLHQPGYEAPKKHFNGKLLNTYLILILFNKFKFIIIINLLVEREKTNRN